MEENFWQKLSRPFFVLAPMANVTDAAFRRMFAKYDGQKVLYTEFVSADGLARANPEGKAKLMKDLIYTEAERPIVAQFFTSTPAHMEAAAKLAVELGFDGIDINMGCPDRSVEKQCAGASLIRDPKLAREIIRAAKRGAEGKIPVSVKTRLGYNTDVLEAWLPEILAEEPAVVTIHARTRKEMSAVPAKWERVKKAVEIRNTLNSKTLIVGNGDVQSLAQAKALAEETGADGIMIGRGAFGKPWFFSNEEPPLVDRLLALAEHAALFEELLGDTKSFAIMKKHFKAYVNGFDGAKELRERLMLCDSAAAVKKEIDQFVNTV